MPIRSIAFIQAAALVLIGAGLLVMPRSLRAAAGAFPRSRAAALALTALAFAWVLFILIHAELGRFSWLRPLAYVAVPAAFFGVIALMDELLAPRALGGLLMLAADPALQAARMSDAPVRGLVSAVAYAGVVLGMVLVLSPYRFRLTAERLQNAPGLARGIGALAAAAALALLGAGLAAP